MKPEAILKLALAHASQIRLVPPATLEISLAGEDAPHAERLRKVSAMLGALAG